MAPREKRQNPIRDQLEKAAALDRRRQYQIQNQVDVINRLSGALVDGSKWTYDQEMAKLHEQLAAAQYSVEVLTAELEELRKLPGANVTGGTEKA